MLAAKNTIFDLCFVMGSTVELNVKLSQEQAKFALILEEEFSEFSGFWDLENRECLLDQVEQYLTVCSRSEGIMLRFLVAVWLRHNRFNFDLIDAIYVLDDRHLRVIKKWVNDPWWP